MSKLLKSVLIYRNEKFCDIFGSMQTKSSEVGTVFYGLSLQFSIEVIKNTFKLLSIQLQNDLETTETSLLVQYF